jgi:hypothetical protein
VRIRQAPAKPTNILIIVAVKMSNRFGDIFEQYFKDGAKSLFKKNAGLGVLDLF